MIDAYDDPDRYESTPRERQHLEEEQADRVAERGSDPLLVGFHQFGPWDFEVVLERHGRRGVGRGASRREARERAEAALRREAA